jgi:hypothetical protein
MSTELSPKNRLTSKGGSYSFKTRNQIQLPALNLKLDLLIARSDGPTTSARKGLASIKGLIDFGTSDTKRTLVGKRPLTLKELELKQLRENSVGILNRLRAMQLDRELKKAKTPRPDNLRSSSIGEAKHVRTSSALSNPHKISKLRSLPSMRKSLHKIESRGPFCAYESLPSVRLNELITDCNTESSSNKSLMNKLDRIHRQVMKCYKQAEELIRKPNADFTREFVRQTVRSYSKAKKAKPLTMDKFEA